VGPVDVALGVLALALLGAAVHDADPAMRYGSAVTGVAVLLLLGRHRRPTATAVGCFALVAVAMRLAPQASALMFVAVLAGFAVVGTAPNRRAALAGWAVGVLVLTGAMAGNPYVEGVGDVVLTLTFCTIVWSAGLLAAERGRAATRAEEHADQVRLRRDADLATATAHERARIAGELHDVVSHGLSLVVVQVVAARMELQDLGVDPAGSVDRRLGVVEETAREGLADMRRLLGLLATATATEDATAAGLGLDRLPGLVDQARAAGLAARLDMDSASDLPSGLDAAAYRIVQEALTNVLKHAPGAAVLVTVRRLPDVLRLEVRNGPARAVGGTLVGAGAGYGLVGMQQRVQLYDGTMVAGPEGDGFAIVVELALERVP
jgi:signal transduction histidine kinase